MDDANGNSPFAQSSFAPLVVALGAASAPLAGDRAACGQHPRPCYPGLANGLCTVAYPKTGRAIDLTAAILAHRFPDRRARRQFNQSADEPDR